MCTHARGAGRHFDFSGRCTASNGCFFNQHWPTPGVVASAAAAAARALSWRRRGREVARDDDDLLAPVVYAALVNSLARAPQRVSDAEAALRSARRLHQTQTH